MEEDIKVLYDMLKTYGNGLEWIEPNDELGIVGDSCYVIQQIVEKINLYFVNVIGEPILFMKSIDPDISPYDDNVTMVISFGKSPSCISTCDFKKMNDVLGSMSCFINR